MLKAWSDTGVPSKDWMGADGTPLWRHELEAIIRVEEEFTFPAWPRSRSSILTTGIILANRKRGGALLHVVTAEYLYALVLLRCIERGVL